MRSSGILLHITSLPGPYGIGDLGPQACKMVDFLESAGQSHWQVLPLNPTDGINGYSPYSCCSAFAGNPLLISPQIMVRDGFLAPGGLNQAPCFDKNSVEYDRTGIFKNKLFNTAFIRFMKMKDKGDYTHFYQSNRFWLDDYAVFAVAKEVFKGKCWNEWPVALRHRQPKALAKFVKDHAPAMERVKFIQFLFFSQWHRFKEYANRSRVKIMGDIPIYVNYDSAEVWRYPQFFKLDASGESKFVSGCPPDYFSKTGQRWGNPVYDWAQLKKDKYGWWVRRMEHNLKLFDHVRIDHFRGFLSFWQIPAHEKFAVFGRWVKSPGKDLFKTIVNLSGADCRDNRRKTLRAKFKELPLIAEDLGEITPDVPVLMREFGFPGMRVLLFAFSGDLNTNPHVPAHYPAHCVAYTGTHDNNTIQGWYHAEAKPHEKANIPLVLGRKVNARHLHWAMIEVLMKSKANMAIVPLSDALGLGQEARMNTPATKVNNWKWRVNDRMLTAGLARKLFKLTKESGRI
ncbi:MAG: 4-alpha-glucanotransferase [Candidatus Omnitrophica bacterium]|nr:4-alpha-glucanotransferase [Candidatus Omnitrophota bacterium]